MQKIRNITESGFWGWLTTSIAMLLVYAFLAPSHSVYFGENSRKHFGSDLPDFFTCTLNNPMPVTDGNESRSSGEKNAVPQWLWITNDFYHDITYTITNHNTFKASIGRLHRILPIYIYVRCLRN